MPVFVTVPEVEWACGCRTVAEELVAVCIVAQRRDPDVKPRVERVIPRLAPTCYRLDQQALAAETFTLAASPATLTVVRGANQTSTITVTATGPSGEVPPVVLAASGQPEGVTVTFNPTSTITTSVATVAASSTAALGAATLTILGATGEANASTTIAITVNAT